MPLAAKSPPRLHGSCCSRAPHAPCVAAATTARSPRCTRANLIAPSRGGWQRQARISQSHAACSLRYENQ